MTDRQDALLVAWWAKTFDQLDLEIAREALLCDVKLLEPGVIDRVLRNDASVCGVDNKIAFAKLHNLAKMHFAVLKKSVDAVGPATTEQIQAHVIERLKAAFAAVL
jgi:hypothetical protein